MPKFDRSEFKATSLKSLVGENTRAGYLNVNEGENKFRIFPAFPGEKTSIYEKSTSFLPRIVKDESSGEEEIKRKPVFNAKVHSNSSRDLVEEYIKYLTDKAEKEVGDSEELNNYLAPLRDYKRTIKAGLKWVCYAYGYVGEQKKFGLLEITNGTKEKLNNLAAEEEADEPMGTDPFTDPDDGVAIILTYNPKAKDKNGKRDMKNFYKIKLEKKKVSKHTTNTIPTPLEDEDLELLMNHNSLEKLFVNSFRPRDFELQLEGLEIFDEENQYGLFEEEGWIEIVRELKNYYDKMKDKKEGEEEEKPTKKKVAKTAPKKEEIEVEEEEEEKPVKKVAGKKRVEVEPEPEIEEEDEIEDEDGDKFSSMSRSELKAYNKANKLGIVVKQSYTDEDIRDMIRGIEEEEGVEEEGEETEVEESDDVKQEEEKSDESSDEKRKKMEEFKARLKKKREQV